MSSIRITAVIPTVTGETPVWIREALVGAQCSIDEPLSSPPADYAVAPESLIHGLRYFSRHPDAKKAADWFELYFKIHPRPVYFRSDWCVRVRDQMESPQAAKPRIRITSVPKGEASPEVRQAWVGLELPITGIFPHKKVSDVITSNPQILNLAYEVDFIEALKVLASKDLEAANWWLELRMKRVGDEVTAPLYFDDECCELCC